MILTQFLSMINLDGPGQVVLTRPIGSIAGALVYLDGSSIGVLTNDDGSFEIEVHTKIFTNLIAHEKNGISFCNLEVTAHVSYSVPCGYEQQYLYIFTGESLGVSR